MEPIDTHPFYVPCDPRLTRPECHAPQARPEVFDPATIDPATIDPATIDRCQPSGPADPVDPVDLVALAELCDAIFCGDPSERSHDPHLLAIVDSFGAFSFMEYGPVSYRQLDQWLVPPPGCRALVLQCGGWAAPLDDDAGVDARGRILDERSRPSRHPQRRRMFSTTVIGNDCEIVTMIRVAGDAEPQVLTGPCLGRVPDAMRACWSRRAAERAA